MTGRLAALICIAVLVTSCASKRPDFAWISRNPQSTRLYAPPQGKSLVNFHRSLGAFTYALYDQAGTFLCDAPPYGEFQYVCDPGEQVFIGWILQSPVSVVQAELAPNKVYDILILETSWERPHLVPLAKGDERRAHLSEYEAEEDPVSMIRSSRILKSEAQVQPKIEEIRKDFFGGPKSDRVVKLAKEDCR
jgi:hypothetical protein